MIVVEALVKYFENIKAIDELSFSIPRGQILALLGPNGAGKSTTLRILAGILRPTSGRVVINGIDLKENPTAVKKQIGYLGEKIPLYPEMTVYEFLTFIAEVHKISDKDKAIDRIKDLCKLSEILQHPIQILSKYDKQQVGLAQALIHDPQIMILDEPSKELDPNQRMQFQELIKTIGSEKTIIFSTNFLEEASAICERMIFIANGQLMEDSTTDEFLKRGSLNQVFGELTLGVYR